MCTLCERGGNYRVRRNNPWKSHSSTTYSQYLCTADKRVILKWHVTVSFDQRKYRAIHPRTQVELKFWIKYLMVIAYLLARKGTCRYPEYSSFGIFAREEVFIQPLKTTGFVLAPNGEVHIFIAFRNRYLLSWLVCLYVCIISPVYTTFWEKTHMKVSVYDSIMSVSPSVSRISINRVAFKQSNHHTPRFHYW